MINTYNETDLHKTLKNIYAKKYDGKTEVSCDGFICDILTDTGLIIEIQTANLGKIRNKLLKLNQHKVILVYPLVVTNYIESFNETTGKVSKRKSPKKPSIYTLFNELMYIFPLLTEDWFSLEVVEIVQCEKRIHTDQLIQYPNKSRRFRKNWYKNGKSLIEILETHIFSKPCDYFSLLPNTLPTSFTAKELSEAGVGKMAYKMLWTLKKSELVVLEGKKGRADCFTKNPAFLNKKTH